MIGLRNNAASALGYYPEHAPVVAPALSKTLGDEAPLVRLMAAQALNRVDPTAAKKARAMSVLRELLQNPDDQIASRAAAALREFKNDSDAAITALIEALQSSHSLVACQAVRSLERGFPTHAERIIPELRKTAERVDHVGRYAKAAIKNLETRTRTPDAPEQ